MSNGDVSLRLQVLSYDPTSDALQLLRIGRYQLASQPSWKARVFATNRCKSVPASSLSEIEEKFKNCRLNSLMISTVGPNQSLRMALDLSPNNSLWADTTRAGEISLRHESMRIGFESLQMRVALLGISSYPNELDCRVPLVPPTGDADLYKCATDWLISTLKMSAISAEVFGAMDFQRGLVGEDWSSIANGLDCADGGTDQNIGKFDTLHDFMIAPAAVGRELALQLGSKVAVTSVDISTNPMVVLELPLDPRWRRDASIRAAGFLARPPAPRAQRNGQDYPILSKSEYDDLDARGLVPRLSWDWVVHPILNASECMALGISAADVLVLPMHRATASLVDREGAFGGNVVVDDMLKAREAAYNHYFNSEYVRQIFGRLRRMIQKQHAE